jgi:aromatic-L-amino-acid/L-tryptophan decarboxylase
MSSRWTDNLTSDLEHLNNRYVPLKLSSLEFKNLGYKLIDQLADYLDKMPTKQLPSDLDDAKVYQLLEQQAMLNDPQSPEQVLNSATELLCNYAISTSHPRFFAYIMGAGTPFAALADLLASCISPPMTSYTTSKLTVALEAQTIQWLANLLEYPSDCSGLFLSGGSIANFIALLVSLNHILGIDIRHTGLTNATAAKACLYVSVEAHSSVIAAAEMSGLGKQAVRVVEVDRLGCMDIFNLTCKLNADIELGYRPFMIVATAGTTGRGAIDPLVEIAAICKKEGLWFHVDGAYGAAAVVSPEAPEVLRTIREADSLTIDPHKWLYVPADVGCFITRHRQVLFDTFNQGAAYYASDAGPNELGGLERLQFRDLGPQTTRAFRALRVRLSLMAAGRDGYKRMITDDILLAKLLFHLAEENEQLEALSHSLSITNFRYVPAELKKCADFACTYLNELNREILRSLNAAGKVYVSHTLLNNTFAIRVCIVNCNTTADDIKTLIYTVVELGLQLHKLLWTVNCQKL